MGNLIMPLSICAAFFLGLSINQVGPQQIVNRARLAQFFCALTCVLAVSVIVAVTP